MIVPQPQFFQIFESTTIVKKELLFEKKKICFPKIFSKKSWKDESACVIVSKIPEMITHEMKWGK